MSGIAYRQAALNDAAEIHALLLRIAPEIPLLVDTLEREEVLYGLTRNCARSGESWVACDAAGRIVGFALAAPNQHGRHYAEQEQLDLYHAGVAPEHDRPVILAALIGKLLARQAPVATSVSPQNRTGLAACLDHLGFRPSAAPGGEQCWRWQPGAATAT